MLKQQIAKNRRQEWGLLGKALIIDYLAICAVCYGYIYDYTFFFRIHPHNKLDIETSIGDAIIPAFRTAIQPQVIGLVILLTLIWWGCTVIIAFAGVQRNNITAVMKENQAVPVDLESKPRLAQAVTKTANDAGIPVPQLFIIDNPAPNAFAFGKDTQHAAIAVTSGLLKLLRDDELQAVLGHEIATIRNHGTRLMMLYYSVNRAVWNLGLGLLTTVIGWLPDNESERSTAKKKEADSSDGAVLVLTIAILVIILPFVVLGSPVVLAVGKLLNFSLSQEQEFAADAGAVELTRNKQGMIKTLNRFRKIQREMAGYEPYSRMYFVATSHGQEKKNVSPARSEQPSLLARIQDAEEITVK